ncbi:MAG: hypothetical protein NTW66_04480 [Candidatus Magasanikbacteria bacterium]|nr:hypothetical protein [Candidatus Magasanikbacteria bacterium]
MPVEQKAEYKMFRHTHTIIPVIGEYDIAGGIVYAMIRRFRLNLTQKQVQLGRVILSEQLTLGCNKTGPKKHTLHLVMCAETEDIPKALVTACEMLGIPPEEKIGVILSRRKPNINVVAENIAQIDRFKTATIILM